LPAVTELGATGNPDAVRVGCLYPLTGTGSRYGRDSVIAIGLALDDLDARTTGNYPPLRIAIEDTKSKSLRAVQIARSFIDQYKVDFLCGVVSSRVALAVTEVAREKRTFFIGTDHASPRLVTSALHPWYFRVSNGTRQSMRAGAQYIQRKFTGKAELRIAFIGPDYDYGYQAWKDLRHFLRQSGVKFKIAGEYWTRLFETDYSLYIQALLDSGANIIINGHWGGDLIAFVRQARAFGLFDKAAFMNFDAGGNYEILEQMAGEMPRGLILSARHHNNWPDTRANRHFVETFREKSGRYPSYAAEGAYAGIIAIAEAIRRAGGVRDKVRLRETFEHLRLKLPEDPQGFESYMDPASHQIMQVQAIGETIENNSFPPAHTMLGNWSIYYPLMPTH